jgi:hypothetical protein
MSERRENSVLFSLKELRNIEDGRVKKEKEDAQARVDADRAAKAAAERAVREAEERRIREEEDRVRRIEDEKLAREREDQMRLQEAERRARVEGEVRLHEERLRLEVQAKHQQKSPLKAILGVAGVLVIIGGGLGYKMYSDHQTELAAARAEKERVEAESAAKTRELEAKFAALQKETDAKLATANTEAERAQIRADAAQRRADLQSGKTTHAKTTAAKDSKPATPDQVRHAGVKKTISDNPLDGL